MLLNRVSIHLVLLFLLLFLTSIKTYSQEQSEESFISQIFNSNANLMPNAIEYSDTVILYSPCLPIIFDGNHLHLNRPLTQECPLTKPLFPPLRFATHRLFADVNHKNDIDSYAYDYLIKNNIRQIKYTVADFEKKEKPLTQMPSNIFHFLFNVDNDFDHNGGTKPSRFQPKRKYWIYTGNHKLQLSQNYISQNWYKGGMKNLNLYNMHNININYKKNRFQTNNFVEWKLNLYTNPNDSVRLYRIAEDLIRTYSDFGIQAIHNWYYSANIEFKTQVFNNYVENLHQILASAFAPLYVNVGILGMRYQIEKKDFKTKGKKLNFNTDISPLSIQYIAVLNNSVDATRFGIENGKRHLTNFGSTINAKLILLFNKYVSFSSRFFYFTNYKNITAESENTLNMPINRYFSTSLYLFVRYDNNTQLKPNPTLGYFQVNELLSFGFNYNW